MVLRVPQVLMELKEPQVQELKAYKALKAHKAQLVLKAQWVMTVHKD
jgi:hypothetical protein